MIEVVVDAVQRRLFQLALLSTQVGCPSVAQGQLPPLDRDGGGVLGRLAVVLHERDYVTAGGQAHEFLPQAHEPVVHLGGHRRGFTLFDLTEQEGVLLTAIPE